jgi:hypothetical protein
MDTGKGIVAVEGIASKEEMGYTLSHDLTA